MELTGTWVGRPERRREDQRLVQGRGAYLDDLAAPGSAFVAFVRSPLPHARIRAVDPARALAVPGMLAVITASDLPQSLRHLPLSTIAMPPDFVVAPVPMPVLAWEEARFQGEPVAAVLADSRAVAEDASDLVELDLEPLPAVGGLRAALSGGPAVHSGVPDNVLFRWRRSGGAVDDAFAASDAVVSASFSIPRLQAAPMEPRGCLAVASEDGTRLTLWCSSQDPHRPRVQLAQLLGWEQERVQVVVPDVGGAFGSKGGLAPEHVVAVFLAMRSRRPVKWVETRSENFLAAYQGRGMDADAELCLGRDGAIRGLRLQLLADAGAYHLGHTSVVSLTATSLATGAYRIPAAEVSVVGVATNKVPTGPYRGAGRPEAAYFIERMMDLAADRLDLDRVEIRRRNLVAASDFPYRTVLGTEYDSGDYPGLLDRALELSSWGAELQRRDRARSEGRLRGVGLALTVESSGNSGWETAAAVLGEDGRIVILPGSSDHGQGHATTFAQIAADAMGVDPGRIEVRAGDSREVPLGVGTFGSRSVTVGGSAVLLALEELRRRCVTWAAHLLDIPEEGLEWRAGRVVPSMGGDGVGLQELAAAARNQTVEDLPELRGDGRFTLPGLAFGSSACVATVELDPETGWVEVDRLVAVDDAGTVVNPLLAEGQVIGSSVQGLAAALFEEVLHDPDGQALTESFLSYAVPTLPDIRTEIVTEFRPTPSPLSPLGTKGVAESGCIAIPAAVANALADALTPLGAGFMDPPFTPEKVWRHLGGASR